MDKMKRFIDCYVPVTTCNLRCSYCYITQSHAWKNKLPKFKYNPEYIGKALSAERLGGICHINMCGGGETLLPPEMTGILRSILEQGHYIMVVTNGTVTKRFDEIITFPKELLNHLGFKFSFHYLELLRTDKLNLFFSNVKKVKDAGCSFSVELTPYDELVPHIDDIQKVCMERIGALCHVTVGRVNDDPSLPILTNNSHNQYKKIWGVFDSAMFNFKMSTFLIKRREYCYAGAWSGLLDLGTGELRPCYQALYSQNIFKNLKKPIKWIPIGCHCSQPHCYNSHSFLTLGVIPSIHTPTYAEMRDRVSIIDHTSWLTPDMAAFLSNKLVNANPEYTPAQKIISEISKLPLCIRNGLYLMKINIKSK
ncbi:MAG: radical SAM protein [Candidatus Cloacimonetes bacterium]|nr:radical SAM protein [Candidatus Cloacimonadota bacterium]